jgi:hypothetical protein
VTGRAPTRLGSLGPAGDSWGLETGDWKETEESWGNAGNLAIWPPLTFFLHALIDSPAHCSMLYAPLAWQPALGCRHVSQTPATIAIYSANLTGPHAMTTLDYPLQG